jgi:fructose-1,6-bisphosphatase/inositol monophosphatase family enzyme
MTPDIDQITDIVTDTAAREVRPRFRALARDDVREKAAGDLVTVADERAEQVLTGRLKDALPGSEVLGEEAAERDPAVFDHLAGADPVWVIDPVDGTGNFARGVPTFAVMLALVQHGRTRAAWIHEPMHGRTTVAAAGEGAWQDGARLRAAAAPTDPGALTGTLHAGTWGTRDLVRRLDKRRRRVNAVKSLRCAGAEYVRLARGEQHFSVFTKLAPWDHAPGTLILQETGGVARLSDGRDYTPMIRQAEALLLAPDEATWRRLHDVLLAPDTAAYTNAR